MDHHHHQNNCKVSNTEFADVDFDDPIFSNPILSSLNFPQRTTTASATVALADTDCPQPQLHVPLPPRVQQKLNTICEEKEQPQPDAELRRKLGLLGEEKALELLGEIYNTKTKIRSLSGYIGFMLRQEKYQCAPHSPSPSPSLSPSKSAPAASCLLHSPSSASSTTPGRQGNTSGGQRELYSCLSTTPSKSAPTSLFQVPSSAPHNTSAHQGEALTNRSADQPGHDGRAQLEALGELEFRKQFLILNYAGGEKLENVIAPETIRSWKGMPMQQFEKTVWDVLGSKYTRKEDRQWLLECFKQSKPWIDTSSTRKAATTSPPEPSALLPDHIEDALFKQFLTTRFEPSFAVGAASDYWLAYMDEYLTLGDGHEKRLKEEKMLRLVDLYYDALDAPKKDRTLGFNF